jgi:hypothetical protein
MLEKLKQTDRPPVLGEKNRNRPLVGPNFSRAFRVKYFFPGRSLGCLLRNEGKKRRTCSHGYTWEFKRGNKKEANAPFGILFIVNWKSRRVPIIVGDGSWVIFFSPRSEGEKSELIRSEGEPLNNF